MSKSPLFTAIIVGVLSVSAAAVASPTTSATVELGGSVDSSLALESSTSPNAELLDLSNGRQIVKVADLFMITNNEQGLTLRASSGSLTKSGGTPIAFQVTTVDASASAPSSGSFEIESGIDYLVGTSSSGAVGKDLYIMYTPLALQDPGYYDGVINLTVTDN